jgi:hypothetical protein
MTGGAGWPLHGEIDIVENVNLAARNQYSLHTLDGCKHPAKDSALLSTYTETGNLISSDCFVNATGQATNMGCLVADSELSFGAGFKNAGGGAFAMLWDDKGIRIWFFTRAKIPSDLPTGTPNPEGWGAPVAYYPQETCDTDKFFGPQTMILNINVCGNFAVDVFATTCPGRGVCTDLVPDPENYHDAFFEIRYLTHFTTDVTASPSTSATASSKPTGTNKPTTAAGTGSGASPAPTSAGVSAHIVNGVVVAGAVALGAMILA